MGDQPVSPQGRAAEGWVASAPAKLILFGEHAVVYGKSAVAASLNLRTFVESSAPLDSESVVVERPNMKSNLSWTLEQLNQIYKHCISSGWLLHDDKDDNISSHPFPCHSDMKTALFSFCGQDKGAVAFLYLYFTLSPPHTLVVLSKYLSLSLYRMDPSLRV
eukprot:TRINITY_DN114_c0_g1_i2.p2 TRINITY_DN114_c0_g1~~TRINITY_DN114_c0_g1_i2.p2  ORF type:complete len:172 (-),score=36.33 TRINITY_DN114_c0_g1_i2:868-1353(-)